jgi:hypothetical protein
MSTTGDSCFLLADFLRFFSSETVWPNQKQELPVAAMFVRGSGQNEHSIQRTIHRCFLPSVGSFGQTVSEEKNLKKSANKKQESPRSFIKFTQFVPIR